MIDLFTMFRSSMGIRDALTERDTVLRQEFHELEGHLARSAMRLFDRQFHEQLSPDGVLDVIRYVECRVDEIFVRPTTSYRSFSSRKDWKQVA